MKPRTLVVLVVALAAVVLTSYLSLQNKDLLSGPFWLGEHTSVPLYVALLGVFLVGFLPTSITLLVGTLKGELALRTARRSSRSEESLDRTFRRAVDLQKDGQLEKALNELEILLQARPDDFAAVLRYGELLRSLGRFDDALTVHQRGSAAHPKSVALLYELIEDYKARDEHQVAQEISNRILREFPGRGAEVLRRRRSLAMTRGDWLSATELHEELGALLSRADADADRAQDDFDVKRGLLYQRGVRLLEEDRPADGAEVFERLLSEESRFIPAVIMLGEARALGERWDEAVAIWRRGFEETGRPVLLQRIEDHFIEREQPAQAIETLRALIASASEDLLPRFFLGRLYYRLEMLDEAQRVLLEIDERIASSPTYHFLLGRIHERKGEIRLAAERYLTSARQLGVHNAEYICSQCEHRYPDWHDRCSNCGAWNSVELGFEAESLSAADLGVVEVPVWRSGYVDAG